MDNICIVANGLLNGIVALIMPNQHSLRELAITKFGMPESSSLFEICNNTSLVDFVHASIIETGFEQCLKPIELPSLINLCHEEWTPDNNLLTAAMKLKRNNIAQKHAADIERMFSIIRKNPSKARIRKPVNV